MSSKEGLKGEFIPCFNTVIALEVHYKLLRLLNAYEANYRVGTLLRSKRTLFFGVDEKVLERAFGISERYDIKTNDAAVAATMLEKEIGKIYTDNIKDFKGIKGIKAENPIR